MNKTDKVLNYMVDSYQKITGSSMTDSELTAHKLMYFAQKTSLALIGEELFDEQFEGWQHGPVLPSLRGVFDFYTGTCNDDTDLSETDKYIIENTIYEYGKYAAWTLRDLSHEEMSWQRSREGLQPYEKGNKKILISDIKEDAKNIRVYDYHYDMFIDEFEDLNEEEFISAG